MKARAIRLCLMVGLAAAVMTAQAQAPDAGEAKKRQQIAEKQRQQQLAEAKKKQEQAKIKPRPNDSGIPPGTVIQKEIPVGQAPRKVDPMIRY